jgi:hypothetical protein
MLFNKNVDEVTKNSFDLFVNGQNVAINAVVRDADNPKKLTLDVEEELVESSRITISRNGETCKSGDTPVANFSNFEVENAIAPLHLIPCKIEAEDYLDRNGFAFEDCSDTGGGQNAGYSTTGYYLDFFVYAAYAGDHTVDLRVAVNSRARIAFYDVTDESKTQLTTVTLPVTGGWQNWQTQSAVVKLKKGKNTLRLHAITDGFNLNWIEIKEIAGAGLKETISGKNMDIYPNPVADVLYVKSLTHTDVHDVTVYDRRGKTVFKGKYPPAGVIRLSVATIPDGLYLLEVLAGNNRFTEKFIKKSMS